MKGSLGISPLIHLRISLLGRHGESISLAVELDRVAGDSSGANVRLSGTDDQT